MPGVDGWDHPRSRGVYPWGIRRGLPVPGSSPLARGLPVNGVAGHFSVRIIPARAGFTRPSSWPGRSARDHPRSRGVYGNLRAGMEARGGSSPLARGLLAESVQGGAADRIIPARAGFTCPRDGFPCRGRDHPRSRGVYGARDDGGRPGEGSSPLARGLRVVTGLWALWIGIIPARAGFTCHRRWRPVSTRDHPRSRGVYASSRSSSSSLSGSSPLARGLRCGW